MKRLFIVFVCLTMWMVAASAQSYDALCERAATAIGQDSLLQAEEYIKQALKLDPANERNAMLFSNLGTIQRRQRRYDEALQSYSFALNAQPNAVPILLSRATLYMELGKDDLARVDYSQALDVEPTNIEALLMRAYIYMQQRNYPFARADYQRLLKLNAKHYNARLGLATLCQREKKPEEALNVLNEMLEESPSDALLLTARAGVEQDLNRTDAALVDLDEAIRLDTTRVEAYLMRGQLYLTQKKKVQAKQDFEQAMKLGIPYSELRDLLKQCN